VNVKKTACQVALLFVAFTVILVGALTDFAESIKPSEILRDPAAFDGKHVMISRTVQNVIPKTSRKDNDYETFDLCDASGVRVFTWGHPDLREGQHLSVSGTFDAVKHVGA